MTGKPKALAAAVLAFLALSAALASPASADTQDAFYVHDGNSAMITLHAETPVVWEYSPGASFECSELTIHEATMVDGATNLTVTPTYNKEEATCPTSLGTNARITMNGCHITYTGLTDSAHNGDAGVLTTCPEGKEIEIDAGLGCVIKETSGQEVYGVTYHNILADGTADDITITTTISGIHTTANFACQLAGLPATTSEGTLTRNLIVEGFEDVGSPGHEGEPTGIYVAAHQ